VVNSTCSTPEFATRKAILFPSRLPVMVLPHIRDLGGVARD
jgi:hypothetical protein